jgi:integrase
MKSTRKGTGKDEFPKVVRFGGGKVHVARRGDGRFALTWREVGLTRRTTQGTAEKAVAWAEQKARDLDGAVGRRWVTPAEGEVLEGLKRAAGTEEGALGRLAAEVTVAVETLGGAATLSQAARYYAERGPLKVQRTTVAEAIERFLGEYARAPEATRRTFAGELRPFAQRFPGLTMLELDQATVEAWTGRKVAAAGTRGGVRRKGVSGAASGGDGELVEPAARTLRGRITTWVTFLNRARYWNLLGPGKHAAELVRRPVIPDAGREILTVEEGRALLMVVREEAPKLLGYLLVAGWLGLRPSECQRLTWGAFDWGMGYCHVGVATAQKTSTERYVPMDGLVAARLREVWAEMEGRGRTVADRVCGFRSREFLSALARGRGVVSRWVPDVLRHSFCSYRLAVTQDLARVAEEAGNSPAIIRSNYRKPVRAEDGAAWWGLLEEAAGE